MRGGSHAARVRNHGSTETPALVLCENPPDRPFRAGRFPTAQDLRDRAFRQLFSQFEARDRAISLADSRLDVLAMEFSDKHRNILWCTVVCCGFCHIILWFTTPMSADAELMALGHRLRDERLATRKSQAEFGQLAGVSENSQTAYEKGKTPPTVSYLLKLRPHGVDIGYVLTGVRLDSSLGFEGELLVELFGKLSEREREGVMQLLMILGGQSISTAEIGALAKEARGKLTHGRQTLQDRREDYRGANR